METNKRRKLKSDEGSQVQTKSWLLAASKSRSLLPLLYLFLFLQASVAGNKADINVNTNTPWNGLHF
jgi:hypothetical protein